MEDKINITSAQYVIAHEMGETEANLIIATVDGVEMTIPLDPTNRHYAEILRQVEAGTLTIADAETP